MNDNLLLKRLFIAISGIILILVSIYGYRITKQRQYVLENGKMIRAIISEVSYGGRAGTTIRVQINNKSYDAGDAIENAKNYHIGDPIDVLYIENSDYAVLKERINKPHTYAGYFTIEIISFILGIIVIILSPFMKKDSKKFKIENFNWIDKKEKNTKKLDNYFDSLLKNSSYIEKIDKDSFIKLNQKIEQLYLEFPKEIQALIKLLHKKQDYKLDYLYQALLECDSYSRQNYESELKYIYNEYIKSPSKYDESIIQTFFLSSFLDDEKNKEKTICLVETRFNELNADSQKNIKKIIKTCT